jgi:hypothetical protein
VVAVLDITQTQVLVVLVVVVLAGIPQLQELQTLAGAVVQKVMVLEHPLMAAQALSSFATQAHLLMLQA